MRPIESIDVGDEVLAWDPETCETTTQTVTALTRPEPKLIWRVMARDGDGETEAFEVTDDHPWYVEGAGWVETQHLTAGQRIETADDRGLLIFDIARTDRVERTYNLTVSGPRTFLVGEDGATVHNVCPIWRLGAFKSLQRWTNQMARRGWTPRQITEAIRGGQKVPAVNNVNLANTATRYVHPVTGQSVVLDDVTREVLQVGGPGFRW